MKDRPSRRALDRFLLDGKTALVTGSYRGLGFVLARALAEAGAAVILNGRNSEELEKSAAALRGEGFSAHGYSFDIRDEMAIDQALTRIEKEVGPVDILVNNAGIQERVPLEEASLAVWNKIIETNLTGAFLVSRRVVKGMIARKSGKIINICSLASLAGRRGIGPYTAAKGGLKMLTRAMCADWGGYNIQINGIAPGYFLSEMTASLKQNPDFDAWIMSRTPARRWGDPRELTGPLLLFASASGDFVNGQVLAVDGGIIATM